MTSLRIPFVVLCAAALLSGCMQQTVREIDARPVSLAAVDVGSERLLDVGVLTFDPNIPDDFEERELRNIVPEVREAEAQYLPFELKEVLTATGQWGAVRVLPRDSTAVDVTVRGRIEHADGERLDLHVVARDATGAVWIDRLYTGYAVRRAYDEDAPLRLEPFITVFQDVAADLAEYREGLAGERIAHIRTVGRMRFAGSFAPEAFGDYVELTEQDRWVLRRLPAEGNPMMERIEKVRRREHLFIDTLDGYYERFHRTMREPYQDFRRYSYDEIVALNELRREARQRLINGFVGLGAGIAAQFSDSRTTRAAGAVALFAGYSEITAGFDRRNQFDFHIQAIKEAGSNLASDITPHVIELDDRVYTLSGNVDDQYDQWRGLLDAIYRRELGLDADLPAPVGTSSAELRSGDTATARDAAG